MFSGCSVAQPPSWLQAIFSSRDVTAVVPHLGVQSTEDGEAALL